MVLRASTTSQDNPRSHRAIHRIYTVKNDKADSGSQIRISYSEVLMAFFYLVRGRIEKVLPSTVILFPFSSKFSKEF